MAPDVPRLAVPVDIVTAPLVPSVPELGVSIMIDPLDVASLAPVKILILPPVAESSVYPAERRILPPGPCVPLPTFKEIVPPWPSRALPVDIANSPDVPSEAVPVETMIAPLTPSAPAFAVMTETEPLLAASLVPDLIVSCPPVPAAALPPLILMCPPVSAPLPNPSPPVIKTSPPLPPLFLSRLLPSPA